jgi:hypothetical protein
MIRCMRSYSEAYCSTAFINRGNTSSFFSTVLDTSTLAGHRDRSYNLLVPW